MNRVLLLLSVFPVLIFAQDDDYSYEEFNTFDNMGSDVDLGGRTCFGQVKARYDITGKAKLSGEELESETLRFGEGEAALSFIHLASKCTGYNISLGYQNTLLDFNVPTTFSQNVFHNAYISLGVKSDCSACWTWQAEVSINVDLERFCDHSTLYLYGGWGRYQVNDCFFTSVGFIGRSGIHQDRFWPVIGFEYLLSKKWTINFVYPVNMAVIYKLTDSWALAAVVHVINTRHRVGPDEPIPNAIWEYRNTGIELALNYEMGPMLSANIHAGVMGEGDLKISEANDNNSRYYKPRATGYLGADASLRF